MAHDVRYEDEPQPGYDEPREHRAHRDRPQKSGLGGRQDRLWKAAEVLDNTLDTLAHRLGPVLLPERPSALGAVTADQADMSDLGGFFDHLTERLETLGRRAAELSERIDL